LDVSRDRARGALLGMAVGDALGTTLEFKPPGTFEPISDIIGGGPFALAPGQWTDDTSMGLCLAESLISCSGFNAVDQLERYVRWWRHGHLSSTGTCFDIGSRTSGALAEFERTHASRPDGTDEAAAGNGSIMRLAAVPVAYAGVIDDAVRYSGLSSTTTHPARRCVDACRFLGALIASAVTGTPKQELLSDTFWRWGALDREIAEIAAGSFKRRQPPEITGSGFVVRSLEAALWALHNSRSFRDGALLAVNLGNDADTTGAVYGQLAGAIYGESAIPEQWRRVLASGDQIAAFADQLLTITPRGEPTATAAREPPTSESYWVDEQLLAGKYPGGLTDAAAERKLAALIDGGVRTFIDLTSENELRPYAHLVPEGVQHHRIPVTDVTAPDVQQIHEALDLIDAGRRIGDVYVHCWGGCGRTGVIAGCYLREQGVDAQQAVARVYELTRGIQTKRCPETSAQIKRIAEWTPRPARQRGSRALRPRQQQLVDEQTPAPAPDTDVGEFISTEILDQLPVLSEGEFPPFVVTDVQRDRWRLAIEITRRIAGHDDLVFAEQLYRGDIPTAPDGVSTAAQIVNEPIAGCMLSADDAPHVSSSLDGGLVAETLRAFVASFDPRPFPRRMLEDLAVSVRDRFQQTGELPEVGLDALRECLRLAWRSRWEWLRWESDYGDPARPRSWEREQRQMAALIRACANAIHTQLSEEEQWWWAPDESPTDEDRWERATFRSEEAFVPQAIYAAAAASLRSMIDAVREGGLSVADALHEKTQDSNPAVRYHDDLARHVANGLVAQAARGSDPDLATLCSAHGEASYGSYGLTYERFAHPPAFDLAGVSEAGEFLGVTSQQVGHRRRDGTFPDPYADLEMGPVWVSADIELVRDGIDIIHATQAPDPAVVVGTAEAAALLGVSKRQLTLWRAPNSDGPVLPDPVVVLHAGHVWRRADIISFGLARDAWSDLSRPV
jgi:ADP-ribosyl-[dinitrogen reductase] hydrolase